MSDMNDGLLACVLTPLFMLLSLLLDVSMPRYLKQDTCSISWSLIASLHRISSLDMTILFLILRFSYYISRLPVVYGVAAEGCLCLQAVAPHRLRNILF